MHSWNYRIIRRKARKPESKWFGKYVYNIHEVYYKDDIIYAYTENPVHPIGSSIEDLISSLKMMIKDCEKPVLSNEILEKELKKKKPCIKKAEVKNEKG